MIQKVRISTDIPSWAILFNEESLFNGMELYEYTPLPAWITVVNPITPYISYLVVSPIYLGTFSFDFTLGGSPSGVDATLIIEVVDSLTESLQECNNDSSICLVWITREGGRASYNFNQRQDTGGQLGDSQTFDNNGSIKYINRGKNFTTRNVFKTGLSRGEVDLIESLRYSIQAWEYNTVTDVSEPIVITPEDYNKYTTKNKLTEINIKYRLAEYKEVQNQ